MMRLRDLYQYYKQSTGLSTDTRTLREGEMYVALSGPRHDGNRFALQAISSGASCAVVSDPTLAEGGQKIFYQPNTLTFLHRLARMHRDQLQTRVIGITGSNGKTTTKELLLNVLNQGYTVTGTSGNLNNHIGVPKTLLQIQPEHEIAIVEMGANHPGEIKMLCHLADPDWGIITNIGDAHLEGFGTTATVRETKFALYHHVTNKDEGLFFHNRLESSLASSVRDEHAKVISFDESFLSEIQLVPQLKCQLRGIGGQEVSIESSLYGEHNFRNLVTVVRVARQLGLSDQQIATGISTYRPSANRSQVIRQDNRTIYLDAYNANPTSTAAALDFFDQVEGSKILVLGDMLELGAEEASFHGKILEKVKGMDLQQVVLIGPVFFSIKDKYGQDGWSFYESSSDLGKLDALDLPSNTLVYLKGSRGIALEKLILP